MAAYCVMVHDIILLKHEGVASCIYLLQSKNGVMQIDATQSDIAISVATLRCVKALINWLY